MAENKWTKEQLEAITTRNCNLLVAAAAGAGKTAVLVERIIRRITDDKNPIDIDKLLVVTFTNASATEMRERIAEAISKALDNNPGSKTLQRQLTLLNKASITTIHSFCLEVIRNNFQAIDLDPKFKISNETEALLMKTEALDEIFEDIYENEAENEEFFKLLESYGGNKDDQKLQDMVTTLYEFVQSYPWPEEWLKTKAGYFNLAATDDLTGTEWGKVIIKSLSLELEGLRTLILRALNVIQYSEGLSPYLATFQEDLSNIEAILKLCASKEEKKWEALFNAFTTFEFGRLPTCKKDVDKDKQEYVKAIRDDLKSKVKNFREDIFMQGSEETIADLQYLYPMLDKLCELVNVFSKRYSEKKRKKFLLDFNDLEHFCLEILTQTNEDMKVSPSSIAKDLKEKYEEILVDEYQDSNLVQEIIITMISRIDKGTPNVFMVGDVKQSIYRFRQAKPELFLEKYNSYSSIEGELYRKIQLFKNFRSRKEVVDSVNFIFKQIMSKEVGELNYTDEEALNHGSIFEENTTEDAIVGGATELHIVDTQTEDIEYAVSDEEQSEGEETEIIEEEENLDSIQCEARIVVNRIKELMMPDDKGKSFQVFDKNLKTYRKVEFRDIVILLRATKNWSEIFLEELNNQGIPTFADANTGFFKTVEVQIILSLLQIIDNPLQDIPLLSVLRSPIAAFTQDDLVDIRMADRNASLYEAMKKLALEGNGEISEKVKSFLDNLKGWRKRASFMSTDELIWFLYTDTGFYGFTGAMPGGVQRQSNLRILFERARQFEETSYKGLFNFINFINRLKSSKGDMGSAKILSENENVVRIMSIHKSKGLEFPVVFLSGCGKRFNLMDMNRSMLLHQDLGFGPDFVDYKRRISYPSTPKQALRNKIKIESLSEEMRILYVAFTRAKEKLIITGSVNNFDRVMSKFADCSQNKEGKLPGYEMLKGKKYLDWILPALLRHKDCKLLKDISGVDQENAAVFKEDQSIWEVKAWNKSDILGNKVEVKPEEKGFIQGLEQFDGSQVYSEYSEEISRRLNWEYIYKKASEIPVKLSVTELKRRFAVETSEEFTPLQVVSPILIKKPAFMEESKGFSGAEIGTILHFVMQHLDFKRIKTAEDITFQVGEMVFNELLSGQQAKTVAITKIFDYFHSPLGTRMLESEKVYREVPFNIEISSTEFYKELEEHYNTETLLLQGVIDCFFEENGEIVLLDYKTDYVPQGKLETIREKYRLQIEYYTKALEQLTGKRVKARYVYLFWNGEVLEM